MGDPENPGFFFSFTLHTIPLMIHGSILRGGEPKPAARRYV